MSNQTMLVILAEGVEEIEVVTPVDLLRRAGVECTLAALAERVLVRGRNGIHLQADTRLDQLDTQVFDGLLLPGGPGTARLRQDRRVVELVRAYVSTNKPVGAICAAPTVLADAGVLAGKAYTAHESVRNELPELADDQAVVIDGCVITSRGAGTAIEFGLALIRALVGDEQAHTVADSIHYAIHHAGSQSPAL